MNEGVHKDEEARSAVNRDAQAIPAVPRQPDAQPQTGQQPFTLRDIRVGSKDGRGVPITQIYPKSGSWLGCPLVGVGWDNRGLRFRRG